MKAITLALLAVIAAGVAYLAVSEYQHQRAAVDVAERLASPWGYQAKRLAGTLGIKCPSVEGMHLAGEVGAQRLDRFVCRSEDGTTTKINCAAGQCSAE